MPTKQRPTSVDIKEMKMDEEMTQSIENSTSFTTGKDKNGSLTSAMDIPSAIQTVSAFMIRNIPPVLFFIGVTGNVLTILILSKKKNRVTSTAVFLTFLAVSDIIILLTGILTHWTWIVLNFNVRTTHEIVCKIHVVLTYFSIHFSSWCLVLITFERIARVVVPHKVQLMFSRRKGFTLIAVLACILLIFNLHFFVGADIADIIWHGQSCSMCMSNGSPAYEILNIQTKSLDMD